MSYVKQNFKDGQILNADHLNHIENGIETIETDIKNIGDDIKTLEDTISNLETGDEVEAETTVIATVTGVTAGGTMTGTASMTSIEILQLINAGKVVSLIVEQNADFGTPTVVAEYDSLASAEKLAAGAGVVFSSYTPTAGGLVEILVSANGNCIGTMSMLPTIPQVTANDVGKVLGVDNDGLVSWQTASGGGSGGGGDLVVEGITGAIDVIINVTGQSLDSSTNQWVLTCACDYNYEQIKAFIENKYMLNIFVQYQGVLFEGKIDYLKEPYILIGCAYAFIDTSNHLPKKQTQAISVIFYKNNSAIKGTIKEYSMI